MKKLLLAFFTFSLILTSCKEEPKTAIIAQENADFTAMLESYNEGKLELNPVEATSNGDSRFNDGFPNFLSDDYREEHHDFYAEYASKLEEFNDTDLTESEQLSKAVLAKIWNEISRRFTRNC